MYPKSEKRFLLVNLAAIITLFVLIFAGAVVRSSGSGMGCPDWPKCFGRYIPPSKVSELPAGYQDKYVAGRMAKNERFARMLESSGFADLSSEIRSDKSIAIPESFNSLKTWTEYINRLIGAFCGMLLVACLICSVIYIRMRSRIFFLSLFNVLLVGFQGWLGSIVVSTNLLAWIVTVHMLVALAIVAISIYTYFQARIFRQRELLESDRGDYIRTTALLVVLITLVQITLGTEVREKIDLIAIQMNQFSRSEWVQSAGSYFNFHRNLAVPVVLGNALLFIFVRRKYDLNGLQFRFASIAVFIVILQALSGFILAYLALPPVVQAIHLILAAVLFGTQFYLLLLLQKNTHRNWKPALQN